MRYSDYCTCFYIPEENTVYFYDEIKERTLEKKKVKEKNEADTVMRIWQDNANDGIICQILR